MSTGAGDWKDLFSHGSGDYARFRPTYPESLYQWLADASPGRALAVDVGTGNGQAARALAAHFTRVLAFDPSDAQLRKAAAHPRVEYRVAPAEALPLDDASVDLVLAAQAFHWFDAARFFPSVQRALRPRGLLALVSYSLAVIDPAVDRVVRQLYDELGPFWEPERRLVEEGYARVPAPFPEEQPPAFEMEHEWELAQLAGYLGTWSPLPGYRAARGRDPLNDVLPALAAAWGPAPRRRARWPLAVRVFRRP
jgi:SAM-dependent methyltransferase